MARDRNKYGPPVIPTPDHKYLGGARQMSLETSDAHKYLWVGRIIHVDVETMVCSVALGTGSGEHHDVPLPAPGGAGPRCWSGTIPEPGTQVLLGWKQYARDICKPYIVEFLTVGVFPAREFEPFSTIDPKEAEEALIISPELADDPHVNLGVTRIKLRKAYSGDFLASSSSGSDILLDRDAFFTNRAGNEFKLRDSDQTAILQTVNVFESNSAGYYRRGLIKRNAFNFLPDLAASGFDINGTKTIDEFLDGKFNVAKDKDGNVVYNYVNQIPTDGPAFDKLAEFGLVDSNGKPVFPNDPSKPVPGASTYYPYTVAPDGQRISYATHGEPEISFDSTDQCYVEDRKEIRNTHDGIMAVTEDGDGVQIDKIPPILIEDVLGTVVGNDPYTQSGRSLYKQILKMRVFDSPDDKLVSTGPKFDPVNTVTSQTEADTRALCRLFKVTSPTSGNQYAFGITKEGRVFLHIPKSLTGTSNEKGKSVDANIAGAVKTIIGRDDNSGLSLDLRTQGGVKLDIGAFNNRDPDQPESIAVDLILHGKIRTTYAGIQGRENVINGSDFRSVGSSALDFIQGNYVRQVGGEEAVEATSITHNAGFGGLKFKSAGDVNRTTLGKTSELYAQDKDSTFALNNKRTIIAGIDSTTVLLGSMSRTVVAGDISDTATVGNINATVTTGNMTASVATGNYSVNVGTGNLSLTAGGGNATVTGGITTTISAGATAAIASPVTKIGMTVVGSAIAGAPGPPAMCFDSLTGMALLGVPTISLG